MKLPSVTVLICGTVAALDAPFGVFDLSTTEALKGINLKIPLPNPDPNAHSLSSAQDEYLRDSLAQLLEQLNVTASSIPDLVDEGKPLLDEAFTTCLNPSDELQTRIPKRRLEERDISPTLKSWIVKVLAFPFLAISQKVFLDAALAASFMAVEKFFHDNNRGPPSPTTVQQRYFIYPVFQGKYDDVRVRYNAVQPPGFLGGATFGKDIYIRNRQVDTVADWTWPNPFIRQARLVRHETKHVQQYEKYKFISPLFGVEYIWGWVFGGFIYEQNIFEKEAYATEELTKDIEPTGKMNSGPDALFGVWFNNTLVNNLGYPTEKSYTRPGALTQNLNELKFQNGILQVEDVSTCYRTFTAAEIAKRGVNVAEWYTLGQRSLNCPGYTKPPPMMPPTPPPPPPPPACPVDREEYRDPPSTCRDKRAVEAGQIEGVYGGSCQPWPNYNCIRKKDACRAAGLPA